MELTEKVKRLGAYIRARRLDAGFKTLQSLGDATGLKPSYLSNIETGYINPTRGPVIPSDDVLLTIAKALDIPVSDLHAALGRVDTQPQELVYVPIVHELEIAARSGNLDDEAIRRITRLIRFEAEEAARRQGRTLAHPDED